MKQVICLAAKYPRRVLLLLALITLIAAFQLPGLQLQIAAEGMMINDPEAISDYRKSLQTFGSEAITVIYLQDENLLKPKNLFAIKQLVRRIESIPQVSHTTSLFSARYLHTVNGYTYTAPYFEKIPKTRAAALELARAALKNPLIERNLLSRDGTAMAINVFLDMANHHKGFDKQVADELNKAIAPIKTQLHEAFQLGDPLIRLSISQQIYKDLTRTLPLSLAVLALTLWIVLKRSLVTFIPIVTAVLSVIWILAVMSLLGIPLNVMTAIVPALLVIIGSTEDIHLISEYQTGKNRGLNDCDATQFMAKHMGIVILLTFVTTCLGFVSISLNPIDLLQQFGLMTAIGLCLNFIITATMVPASLQLLTRQQGAFHSLNHMSFSRPLEKIFLTAQCFHRVSLFTLCLLIIFSGYWANKMIIDNNVMDYLPSSSNISDRAKLIRQHLSGTQTLAIVIDGQDEAFLKASNLQQLRELQLHIEEISKVDKSFSFADFIAVIHNGISSEKIDTVDLPDRDEVIIEYASLLSHASLKPFVAEDFNQTRILLRHAIHSSKELNLAVDKILQLCRENLSPDLKVKITGSSYLNSLAADYMADGQKLSLLMMLTIIFILIASLLSSLKIGLIAVIANLFPVISLFAVMGYFDITLNTGTVMVAAIALGICVDHTMHFMFRLRSLSQINKPSLSILKETIRRESRPIVTTALALTLGFATLTLSEFPPVALFGSLSAMVMLLALIGTFVITPYLLSFPNKRAMEIEYGMLKQDPRLPAAYPD